MVGLVLFRFLGIKRVDLGLHQHGSKHEVLEHLYSLRRSGFVVVTEGFVEIDLGVFPILCSLSASDVDRLTTVAYLRSCAFYRRIHV